MDMVVQKFETGNNIIVEGDKANSFYIIKSVRCCHAGQGCRHHQRKADRLAERI